MEREKTLMDMVETEGRDSDTWYVKRFYARLDASKERDRLADEKHRKNMDRINREYLLSTSRLYKELGE